MLKTFISKTETHIQNQGMALRNQENQVGQLANALSSRPSGSLPSNTKTPKPNGKEHCKVIQLRSGKEVTSLAMTEDGQLVNKTTYKVLEKEIRVRDKYKANSPAISPVISALHWNQYFLSLYLKYLHHLFHKD